MEKTLQNNSYIVQDDLFISVENLDELNELIKDIEEKEKALHEAVLELEQYQLKISFANKG